MILTGEHQRTVCSLVALMTVARPGSIAMILTDTHRVIEPGYLIGDGGFFRLFEKTSVAFTLQRSSNHLRLKNGSIIEFIALRNDRDLDRLQGKEPHMIAIDYDAMFTSRMAAHIRATDRTGFSMDDLKRLQSAMVQSLHT